MIRRLLLAPLLFVLCLPLHAAPWTQPAGWAAAFQAAGVHGTMLVYDESHDAWSVFDQARAKKPYLPASTFKLFNAMVALDTHAVKDEFEVIRWDGKVRSIGGKPVVEWNRDNSLASGIRYSTVWFYQEVARRAGQAKMQAFIDKAGYGNRDIGGGIDQFWLSGALRISAEQQVEFLHRLADGKLPFSASAQETVRRISIMEAGPDYILHAKSGWGTGAGENGADIGWYVGWTQYQGRRFFFALNIDMHNAGEGANRAPLARKLLSSMGALPGA